MLKSIQYWELISYECTSDETLYSCTIDCRKMHIENIDCNFSIFLAGREKNFFIPYLNTWGELSFFRFYGYYGSTGGKGCGRVSYHARRAQRFFGKSRVNFCTRGEKKFFIPNLNTWGNSVFPIFIVNGGPLVMKLGRKD